MTPLVVRSLRGSYPFAIHHHPGEISSRGGLYLYVREATPGSWQVLYAGETECLARRILRDCHVDDGHARAVKLGATHVATFPGNWSVGDRRLLEKDLIEYFDPPANDNPDPIDRLIKLLASLK